MQKTMVRRVGALLLGLALFGAACGDDDEETADTTTAPAAGGDTTAAGTDTTAMTDTTAASGGELATPTGATCEGVSLAYFGPLTGDAANLGINIQKGAVLAVDLFNEANPDCQVELVDFDSQGSPDQAPALAAEAINNEAILGVIGPAFSGESAATGDAFNEAGLATVTASATNPDLANNGWATWNRLLGNDALQGPAVARYIGDTLGSTQVFVVDDASEYGKGLADIVRSELGASAIGSAQVQVGETDFSSVVTAANDSGADTVFFGGYYAEAGLLVKQLREGGFDGTFVAGDGVKDVGFVETAGAEAEGAIVTCPCAPPELSPGFLAAYRAANDGDDPQTYGAEAYDAANVFLSGLAEGVTDRAGMVEYARNFTGTGVTKEIDFDDDTGEITGELVYSYKVEGGALVGEGLIE